MDQWIAGILIASGLGVMGWWNIYLLGRTSGNRKLIQAHKDSCTESNKAVAREAADTRRDVAVLQKGMDDLKEDVSEQKKITSGTHTMVTAMAAKMGIEPR